MKTLNDLTTLDGWEIETLIKKRIHELRQMLQYDNKYYIAELTHYRNLRKVFNLKYQFRQIEKQHS